MFTNPIILFSFVLSCRFISFAWHYLVTTKSPDAAKKNQGWRSRVESKICFPKWSWVLPHCLINSRAIRSWERICQICQQLYNLIGCFISEIKNRRKNTELQQPVQYHFVLISEDSILYHKILLEKFGLDQLTSNSVIFKRRPPKNIRVTHEALGSFRASVIFFHISICGGGESVTL